MIRSLPLPVLKSSACPKTPAWSCLGFAARCVAVAVPRRRGAFYFLGYARGMAFGLMDPMGEAREFSGGCWRGKATASHPAAKPNLTWRRTFGAKQKSSLLIVTSLFIRDSPFTIAPRGER